MIYYSIYCRIILLPLKTIGANRRVPKGDGGIQAVVSEPQRGERNHRARMNNTNVEPRKRWKETTRNNIQQHAATHLPATASRFDCNILRTTVVSLAPAGARSPPPEFHRPPSGGLDCRSRRPDAVAAALVGRHYQKNRHRFQLLTHGIAAALVGRC